MRPWLLFIAFLCCSSARASERSDATCSAPSPFAHESAYIGMKPLRFPAPSGFERIKDFQTSYRMQETDPVIWCHLLALFKPLENNPSDVDRICYVQTTSTWENHEIGEESFVYLKWMVKTSIEHDKANKARLIGYFADDTTSLGFTMSLDSSAKAGQTSTEVKHVYSVIMTTARGKLCYLFADASFKSEADLQWTQNAVKAWHKSVQAVNPYPRPGLQTSEDPTFFDEVEMLPFMGGMLGTIVSIFACFYRLTRRQQFCSLLIADPPATQTNPTPAAA